MSLLSPSIPHLIHWRRHCKNGLIPDDRFYAGAVFGQNHILAYRRKPIFRRVCKLGQVGGTSGTAWRWHCRTGYAASRFAVLAILGLDDRSVASDPYISVAITKSGGTATTLEFHGGASRVPTADAPEQWMPQIQYCDADPASVYTGAVTFNDNVRVIALVVYEDTTTTVDDAVPYFSEWTPSMGSPIYDARMQRPIEGIGDLIRYNAALRFDWSTVDGTARTRTSATQLCLIDNASATPPSAATPGVTFCTTARASLSSTTVPITMAVYGSVAGGGTGTVKLRDTAGADAASVTINGAAGWYTATGALTVGATSYYSLYYAGDGVNAVTVRAVSVYQDG